MVSHIRKGGRSVTGPKAFSDFHDQLLTAFSDLSLKILHVVGDDTQAAVHWQVTGTHSGPFANLTVTNVPVSFTGMSFLTIQNGKITEGWDCWDQGALVSSAD